MEFYLNKLFLLKRSSKMIILIIIDFFISIFSLWSSYSLRLGEIYNPLKIDIKLYVILFLIFIVIQFSFKSYHQLSRFFRVSSINNLLRNFILLFFFTYLIRLIFFKNIFFPESITLIYPIIFFILSIFKYSLAYNLYYYINNNFKLLNKKALFYNFNNKTISYLEDINNLNFSICGIVKFSENFIKGYDKKYKIINENEIEKYINKEKITDIIISKNSTYENKIFYFRKFLHLNVRVSFLDDLSNARDLSNSKKIFVPKIEDIIEKAKTDDRFEDKVKKNIKNKVILVAGGAGSIGSVLIEKLNQLSPKKIIIVDKDEFNIFNLKKRLKESNKLSFELCDTSNKSYIEKIFRKFKPDIVYNAAAYKHVSIVEESPLYASFNNIFTAINLCHLSIKYKVKINLLVSTDKAVNPKNIMGMTKRICENIYHSYSLKLEKDRKFIIVRFGNVAGSKGSVIPIFQKLINQRLDLLVTNKKATRYLMSIREASGLIIKASIFGSNSKIYVLDMGEPINIYTLAYNMIKFNGLSLKDKNNIHGDISIKIIGLRKGEKLHEKLSYKNNLIKTKYNKILLCDEEILSSNFKLKLSKYLSKLNKTSNKSILKEEINKLF